MSRCSGRPTKSLRGHSNFSPVRSNLRACRMRREGACSTRPTDIIPASQVRSGCDGPHISQKWEIRDHRSGSGGFSEYFGGFHPPPSTQSLAPLESAHTKTTCTHTHEIYSRSMKLRKWPPACHQLGPPGTHGRPRDLFSAGPQNPEEPHPPFNAMRHTTACLSRACLWLGSLLWGEY
jgi:hypothetical protein